MLLKTGAIAPRETPVLSVELTTKTKVNSSTKTRGRKN